MPAQPLDRPAQQQLPRPRAGAGDPLVREVRVARQAIYDPNRHLRAFELQFRAGGRDAEAVVGEKATSQVVASTFGMFGLDRISDGRPVFISFTRPFITGLIPIPVEPESVIVELPEQAVVDQELLLGLNQLRLAGYRIAVPDYAVTEVFVPESRCFPLFTRTPERGTSPLFRMGIMPITAAGHAAWALGVSKSMLDDVADLALKKARMSDMETLALRNTFQRNLAHFTGMWRAARAGRRCGRSGRSR